MCVMGLHDNPGLHDTHDNLHDNLMSGVRCNLELDSVSRGTGRETLAVLSTHLHLEGRPAVKERTFTTMPKGGDPAPANTRPMHQFCTITQAGLLS